MMLWNEEHLTWIPLPHYKKNSSNSHISITADDDFMPSNDIGWMQKFNHVVVRMCVAQNHLNLFLY